MFRHNLSNYNLMSDAKKRIVLCLFIFAILVIDQASKFYIKLNFPLGSHIEVFPWFQICFVENPGMAFGWEFFDKLFLTIFRIVAVGAITWYLHSLIKQKVRLSYLLTIALILAGAAGNIIDCVFYGAIFSESTIFNAATLFPEGGGYAPWFYGNVVDMLYFPLIHNSAGEVLFFQPVFNIADSAITIAVFILLLFFRKDLNDSFEKQKTE